ncbi:PREDICTED: uncharacterized protein LOC106110697 [Papilio polytes]|uniref:uncharacterized protein LOC106110697 n=1 Tax=Papilio polytes TaxID=76194 RepID=UPI000675DDA4|nr:PREDICTED: uncharacterized protein LOC106110697 [Papilio polytes]
MASSDETLEEFFPKYNPPIRAHKHTCVGLGMEVMKRLKVLEKDFPGNYVEWHERETRSSVLKERLSLVYVARAYLTAVAVTEKRNLVWDLRSLLARDPKGRLSAGIYFPLKLKDQQFTMFFDNNNGKQRKKLKFDTFLELQKIPDEVVDEVEQCNDQLRLRDGELLSVLKKLATIMADQEYMAELLQVNDRIVQLSAGN